MITLSERHKSILEGQNLYLRLLIILLALTGGVEASFRQLLSHILIFLVFMLLDLSLFAKLWRGLRISLVFLAGYWVFATLFQANFPDMLLFTLRIILFISVTVFALGNLSLQNILHDTQVLRKHSWGEKLVHFILATTLYIRAYSRQIARNKPNIRSSIGEVLDNMISTGTKVFQNSQVIEAQLKHALTPQETYRPSPSANLISLCLMSLMVLLNAL